MAKKLPQNEQPYEPVKAALVQSVISGARAPVSTPAVETERPQPPSPPTVPQRVENTDRVEASRPAPRAADFDDGGTAFEREPLGASPRSRSTPTPTARSASHDAERLTREKRCLLTRVEETELEALVQRIANELQTSVKFSHVLRAAMAVIRHAEAEIIDAAKQMGPVSRPANSDATRLAEFEQRLSTLLSTAFRKAPPFRG